MTLGRGVVSGHGLGSGKREVGSENGKWGAAIKRLTARLSHNPPAILASKSAEHGATTTRSAQRRNYAIEERKKTLLDTLTPKPSTRLHELTSIWRIGSPTFFQSYIHHLSQISDDKVS